jgi:two-component system, LytTR family, sensor kinase
MRKIVLFLALISIIDQTVIAQIKWADYTQVYSSSIQNDSTTVGLILALNKMNDSFWVTNSYNNLKESLLKDSSFRNYRPSDFIVRTAFDTSKAQFFLHGVNKNNADEFEFRVLDGQAGEIIPWTNVGEKGLNNFNKWGERQLIYLGGYKTAYGNFITVDVREKSDFRIISSAVVKWLPISPILLNIYTTNDLGDFLRRLQQYGTNRLSSEERSKWESKYSSSQLDEVTGLPKKLKVKSSDNSIIFYLKADIYSKEQIEYELVKNKKVLRPWGSNEFDNSFIWIKNLSPGEYLLKIRYNVQPENVTEYPFIVLSTWYQSVLFKLLIGILSIAFLGSIVFLILFIKQRQKTSKELTNNLKLQIDLKSIHSQLNPHFIFNALSSIQGLINKQDVQGANTYLADFARLMRESLANNNKDYNTLKEEISVLETYLKLEQLRFGFKYYLTVNDINIYETEIPSMLLQPLIENAVKHGISSLKENGIINVEFSKNNNDLVVKVQDNGAGFVYNEDLSGYGLKLTRDRIKLLNQIMTGQNIEFIFEKNSQLGTSVLITFKNWLL